MPHSGVGWIIGGAALILGGALFLVVTWILWRSETVPRAWYREDNRFNATFHLKGVDEATFRRSYRVGLGFFALMGLILVTTGVVNLV
jgi:hypothetical protein